MPKFLKVFLFISAGLALALLVIALALPFMDLAKYKQRLVERASETLKMDVSIEGPLRLRLFPSRQVILNDVHLNKEGQEIGSIRRVDVGFDLLPLLHQELLISSVTVADAVLAIARRQDGSFNVEKPVFSGRLSLRGLRNVSLNNFSVRYNDALNAADYEARACNMDVSDLLLVQQRAERLRRLSLAAELACFEIIKDAITASNVRLVATGNDGKLTVDPVTMNLFDSVGNGKLQLDFSSAQPGYELDYAVPQFQAEAFLAAFFPNQTISGRMDFQTSLTMQGTGLDELRQSLSGTLSLRGQSLTLRGIDLDEELEDFESTQNFSLADAGALFFAGPLGLVVTKGYDYASLFQKSDSNSTISRLISDWTVANAIAQPQDVALATEENIMALQGELDLHNRQFSDMTIAVLDARGCATVQQVITGPFSEPEIAKVGFLMALAAPAISLIKQGAELLPGDVDEECEPFYAGALLRAE